MIQAIPNGQQPLVSIVIANYNYGRFLGEAIQSALDQTYPAVEIILVDDGSTDDSLDVAARYPIQVFPRTNGGVSAARNFGVSQSKGEYILFLDSDDKYEPRTVEALLTALRGAPPHVAYAYCQMRFFGNEDSVWPSRPFSRKAMLKGPFVNICSLVRRSALVAVGGFDPTWEPTHEDAELWMRMLYHGFHGLLVPEPLHLYRCHGPSRNGIREDQLLFLKWRMILTYPTLHWRKILKHPIKALAWAIKLGELRKRHGPPAGNPAGVAPDRSRA
jgi:glycosyltransferase involved in cell wall biosynthesis